MNAAPSLKASAAYRLRVVGDAMSPRLRAGEWVVVEPDIDPLPGDDVVVKIADGVVMVRRLLAVDGEAVILSSLNVPGERVMYPRSELVFVHFVGGRLPARAFAQLEEGEA